MPAIESPCRGCGDREPYCHSSCKRYKDFRELIDSKKAKIFAQKQVDSYFNYKAWMTKDKESKKRRLKKHLI